LHSTPFKRSNDQLEYHDFLPYSFSRLRGISTTWEPLALTMMITKEAQK
jgi:hypothetical protein